MRLTSGAKRFVTDLVNNIEAELIMPEEWPTSCDTRPQACGETLHWLSAARSQETHNLPVPDYFDDIPPAGRNRTFRILILSCGHGCMERKRGGVFRCNAGIMVSAADLADTRRRDRKWLRSFGGSHHQLRQSFV